MQAVCVVSAERCVMPIRGSGRPVPRSGPKRVALAARLASEYEAHASIAELMARGGCGYDDLMTPRHHRIHRREELFVSHCGAPMMRFQTSEGVIYVCGTCGHRVG